MNSNPVDIFKGILSNDNTTRQNSELIISEKKNVPFNEALSFFLEGIKDSDSKVSQLATLMFKKTFLDDKRFISYIDCTTAENLVNNIFYPLVSADKDWKFLERVAENIAKLYSVADLKNSLSQIVALFSNQNAIIRQFAIFLLDSTADLNLIKEELIQISIEDFKVLFSKGLEDPDAKVRILTLKATTTMLNTIKNKSLVMEFACLSRQIIDSLIYCLQNDEDGSKAKSCLETLGDLTEIHPKLWKNELEPFLQVICKILNADQISKTIKQCTFQLILSFSKSTPAYLRKSTTFKENFIPILMTLMKDVDNANDLEAWTKTSEENDNDFEELYFAAREGIEILSMDLGAKYFLDLVNPYISKYFQSSEWTELHSAFVSIGWLAESSKAVFKSDLQNLLK